MTGEYIKTGGERVKPDLEVDGETRRMKRLFQKIGCQWFFLKFCFAEEMVNSNCPLWERNPVFSASLFWVRVLPGRAGGRVSSCETISGPQFSLK